jgi:HK97 gp10 family phage protein
MGTCKITGLEHLVSRMKHLEHAVNMKLLEQAMRAGASVIAMEADENTKMFRRSADEQRTQAKTKSQQWRRPNAPYIIIYKPKDRSKALFAGIPELASGSTQGRGIRILIGPPRERFYLLYKERGLHNQVPQPFLGPAFDAKQDEAMRLLELTLRAGIEVEMYKAV